MGLFSVTRDMVKKLLGFLDSEQGLHHTAGSAGRNNFCVQQAVSLATGMPGATDQPRHCVMPWLITLGIQLNDSGSWKNAQSRAEGLREFAVAELGSASLRESTLVSKLHEKVQEKWPDAYVDADGSPDEFVSAAADQGDGQDGLIALAKMVVETLQEMNCEGTEYLFMANKKEYERPEAFDGMSIPRIKPATPGDISKAWLAPDVKWEDAKPVE